MTLTRTGFTARDNTGPNYTQDCRITGESLRLRPLIAELECKLRRPGL